MTSPTRIHDTTPLPQADRLRIEALVRGYTLVAVERMAGLPVVNPAMRVEDVGFAHRADGTLSGILITPWFLNLLMLPGQAGAWDHLVPGAQHPWPLPVGEATVTVGRLDDITDGLTQSGCYRMLSLMSPVTELTSQDQARGLAVAALDEIYINPTTAPPDPGIETSFPPPGDARDPGEPPSTGRHRFEGGRGDVSSADEAAPLGRSFHATVSAEPLSRRDAFRRLLSP